MTNNVGKSTDNVDTSASLDGPTLRSNRLFNLRKMAYLSREELAKHCGLTKASIAHWENLSNTGSGINEKQAPKVVEVMAHYGVISTVEWLLYGTGKPPYLRNCKDPIPNIFHSTFRKQDAVDALENAKKSFNCDSLFTHVVEDDAMVPRFCMDDVLIAMPLIKEQWEHMEGKPIIATLANEKHILRVVRGVRTETFLLTGINPASACQNYVHQHNEIKQISQIIIQCCWGQNNKDYF